MNLSGRSTDPEASKAALAQAASTPLWLDDQTRPEARPPLDGDHEADLAIVGGGFTGLWAALLALAEEPNRSVILLESDRVACAATGKNGGFCAASITHGVGNGLARWPTEMPVLHRLGMENLGAIEATVAERRIDCDFERTGMLRVAVAPWQLDGLKETAQALKALGEPVELWDSKQTREAVESPMYLGGLLDRRGTAMLNPARLAWGLAQSAENDGAVIAEQTPVTRLRDCGDRIELSTPTGRVQARRVILATNTYPSLIRRHRPFTVPVWDHVIATEPLTEGQRDSLRWRTRHGVGDSGNQFHYYRLTTDNRLVFGGYDALYYYGSDVSSKYERRPETERILYDHMVRTFPGLLGVSISHTWGGAIDTSTRFSASWHQACSGKVVSALGYTGLGVGATRFGAQVCLDLLAARDNERTALEMVRTRSLPWPPEPMRWIGIQLTRYSIARADVQGGRRNIWLRTLDRMGLGFDS